MSYYLVIKETNKPRLQQLQELLTMAGYDVMVQGSRDTQGPRLDQPWDYSNEPSSSWVQMGHSDRLQEKSENLSTIIKWLGKIMDDQPEMMCRFLPDGTLTFVNATYATHIKKTKAQLLNTSIFDIIPVEDHEGAKLHLRSLTPSNPVKTYEHRVLTADGGVGWYEWTDRASFDVSGQVISYTSIGRDITKRKGIEQENQRLLMEKDLILKEAYHRMKNNFQSVVTLIKLKLSSVDSEQTQSTLRSLASQTQAMQLLYEQLLQSNRFDHLELGTFLPTLVRNLQDAYLPEGKVTLEPEIEPYAILAKRGFQLGLIINELATNAIKYGFRIKSQGKIVVRVSTHPKTLVLEIWDNGDGLPRHWTIDEAQGFGINIVRMLCEELDADLSYSSNPQETSFRVEIPKTALAS
jgi:PAS domain S-box-containing protein